MQWRQLAFPRLGPGVRQALAAAMPALEQRAAAIAENRVGTALSRPSPLRGVTRR